MNCGINTEEIKMIAICLNICILIDNIRLNIYD